MNNIKKLLNISSLNYIELIKIQCDVERKGYASIEDFRVLLQYMPGLTTALTSLLECQIVDALDLVKAGFLRYKNYEKLLIEYEALIRRRQKC